MRYGDGMNYGYNEEREGWEKEIADLKKEIADKDNATYRELKGRYDKKIIDFSNRLIAEQGKSAKLLGAIKWVIEKLKGLAKRGLYADGWVIADDAIAEYKEKK